MILLFSLFTVSTIGNRENAHILETFSNRFFMENRKPKNVTWPQSCGRFPVHVWTAEWASSGKWLTARLFATKNCTALPLKARRSFLYPPYERLANIEIQATWNCKRVSANCSLHEKPNAKGLYWEGNVQQQVDISGHELSVRSVRFRQQGGDAIYAAWRYETEAGNAVVISVLASRESDGFGLT